LKVARKTTYINGFDLIRALEKYASEGRLLPTTLFVTFDMADLYTMIPRQGAVEARMRFLVQHLHRGQIGSLSINDIMRMARLVLDTNYFVYKDKYYLQMRGGVMGWAFTMTLANIYMWEWEQSFVEHQQACGELYGRSVLLFLCG
jgi:hypothetical protein